MGDSEGLGQAAAMVEQVAALSTPSLQTKATAWDTLQIRWARLISN